MHGQKGQDKTLAQEAPTVLQLQYQKKIKPPHSNLSPCPASRDAMNKVFPPGAAQQSMIVSPGCGSTTDTTRPAISSVNLSKCYQKLSSMKLALVSCYQNLESYKEKKYSLRSEITVGNFDSYFRSEGVNI
jgi:hypothetical protein